VSAELIENRDAHPDDLRVCYLGDPESGAVWADTELSR